MDTTEKNDQLINLCKKLKYNQRIVFSDEGNLNMPSDVYEEEQASNAKRKPAGLWYSYGPAWIMYLTSGYTDQGEFWTKKRLACITHIYRIGIVKSSICSIENYDQFDEFTKNYGTKDGMAIKWNKVAKDWHGIEIRYLVDKHSSNWYDGWDCSSGCIWNPKAVKKIETLMSWEQDWRTIKNGLAS
jgi:hypothetical protein